jgi:hypothetical protein
MRTAPPRRAACILGLLGAAFLASAAMVSAAAPKQSTDPFFPHSGNFGYDIKHYDVTLGYEPASGQLSARDVIAGDFEPAQVLARPGRPAGHLGHRRWCPGQVQPGQQEGQRRGCEADRQGSSVQRRT